MPKKITIVVKESIKDLKALQKKHPSNYNRLQMKKGFKRLSSETLI